MTAYKNKVNIPTVFSNSGIASVFKPCTGPEKIFFVAWSTQYVFQYYISKKNDESKKL